MMIGPVRNLLMIYQTLRVHLVAFVGLRFGMVKEVCCETLFCF